MTLPPDTYILLNNRRNVDTQTEDKYHAETEYANIETMTDKEGPNILPGGGLEENNISNEDREPQNPREIKIRNSFNLLHIRVGIRSKLIGFENTRNACYMNSLIQSLYNTQLFRNKVLSYNGYLQNIIGTLKTIFKAMGVTQDINDSWYINLEETNLYNQLGFSPKFQSDPRETLTRIIEIVNDIDNEITKPFRFTEIKQVHTPESNITEELTHYG